MIFLNSSLCLEWNAVGLLDNSFAVFCDGVGCNQSLQALDLRNNQINHDEAAELAANLKRNISLKALGNLVIFFVVVFLFCFVYIVVVFLLNVFHLQALLQEMYYMWSKRDCN